MRLILSYIYRIAIKIASICRCNYVNSCISKDSTCPRILGKVYLQVRNLKCGKNVTIYPGAYLWGNNIELGDNVNIGIGTVIYSNNKVTIGKDTIIAGQCYIIDSNHSIDKSMAIQKQPLTTAPNGIEIGEDVWIGAQCSILKGAKINDGAVIGAQSLVNSEIPKNAIAFGTPAKIIKYRE